MRAFLISVAAAILTSTASGAILDRVAVTVGRQVIAESDVVRDVRVAAFLDHKPVDLSGAQKRKAAERLIDQLLILQEALFSRMPLPSKADMAPLLAPLKAEYGTSYAAALEKYQISEDDLVDHLLDGMRALRYTELRFKPEVQFSDADLRVLYATLVAQWKDRGEPQIPDFESSRPQLEKLLTDQKTNQALDRWLATQRAEARIEYRDEVFQ
jgi:hypothetical protein